MRIIFIALEVAPSKEGAFTGGLVNNVIRLSESLTRAGHNVKIITTDVNNYQKEDVQKYKWGTIHAVKVSGKYVSLKSNLEFLLKILPVLKEEEKNSKIDVIHVHSAYSLFGIVSYWISIFFKTPLVFTLYSPVHSSPLNDRKGFYQLFSSALFSKFFLNKVGRLSCLSENIKKSLKEIDINKDISVIPPIVDTAVFDTNLDGSKKRKELGIPLESSVILYCGSWTKWKGVHLLIESIGELEKDFPDIKLITAWGEPYDWYDERKRELDKLIQSQGLGGNIIELGIVKDMQNLISACNIFVAPFLNIDGVADPPLSVLEAMACGKTVIATNVGSMSQIIKTGENGYLIDPNDLSELTDTLRKTILSPRNGNQIGKNATKFVSENYSADAVSSILIDVYNNVNGKDQ
jgi:glycosyltransferase involved in cell wall biosynthesis